jgi:hypothetical protein
LMMRREVILRMLLTFLITFKAKNDMTNIIIQFNFFMINNISIYIYLNIYIYIYFIYFLIYNLI